MATKTTFKPFTKLGAKLTIPSWMDKATDSGPVWPHYFDPTEARAAGLTSLPSDPQVFFSTDHGSGKIGRASLASGIEGTWTELGSPAANLGTETPWLLFDEVNNRVNMYSHKPAGTTYANSQYTYLYTTTDMSTWTNLGWSHEFGQHSGYASIARRGNVYQSYGLVIGGEVAYMCRSTSSSGSDFQLQRLAAQRQEHIAGQAKLTDLPLHVFEWEGEWWALQCRKTGPRGVTPECIDYGVHRIDPITLLPLGPYQTILEPGTAGATDEVFWNYASVAVIGSDLYVIYVGINSTDDYALHLAKMDPTGSATEVPVMIQMGDSGLLPDAGNNLLRRDWDAANDSVPSWISETVVSGTSGSAQVAGEYYSFSSDGAANMYLVPTDDLDATTHDLVEWTLEGFGFDGFESFEGAQFGFTGNTGFTSKTLTVHVDGNGTTNRKYGQLVVIDDSGATRESDGYGGILDFRYQGVLDFFRDYAPTLKMQIRENRYWVCLIDENVVWCVDLNAYAGRPVLDSIKPFFRLFPASSTTAFRFSRWTHREANYVDPSVATAAVATDGLSIDIVFENQGRLPLQSYGGSISGFTVFANKSITVSSAALTGWNTITLTLAEAIASDATTLVTASGVNVTDSSDPKKLVPDFSIFATNNSTTQTDAAAAKTAAESTQQSLASRLGAR